MQRWHKEYDTPSQQRCDREVAVDMLTCSHVADAAPEWPALLAATTTATLILRADPSYPTVALFHVSLTLRKILKRRAAESPTSRSACFLVSRTVLTHP